MYGITESSHSLEGIQHERKAVIISSAPKTSLNVDSGIKRRLMARQLYLYRTSRTLRQLKVLYRAIKTERDL